MVKLGMIGLGGMGTHHAKQIKNMDKVEIVGCCDTIEEKAKEAADIAGSKPYTDFRKLLPKVDAIWVCTQPFNRAEIVIRAAEAGKHIFTEKPICHRIKDAERMVQATDQAGVKYMLGYCLRFWNPYKQLKKVFASGELGELVECWTRRFMPWRPQRWYAEQDKSGGVVGDFGSHDLDLLYWIGGEVKMVFGHTIRIRDGYTADDHAGGILVFKNGGIGKTSLSWVSQLSDTSLGVVGTKGSIIIDRDGTIRKKVAGDEEEIIHTDEKMGIDAEGHRKDTDEKGVTESEFEESLYEHFFNCIEQDRAPLVTGRDGLQVLKIVEALKESGRTGKPVKVQP